MGFLSDVGSHFATGGLSTMGKLMNKAMGGGMGGQQREEIDPRLKEQEKQQTKRAQDYRSNMAGMKEEQSTQASEGSRKELAANLAGVKSNMNSRGLLFSGLNQRAQSEAGAQAASDMAAKRAEINSQVEDTANQLDNQALGTAFNNQQAQQQLNEQAYNDQTMRMKQRQQLVNGIFSSVGSAAGAGAAG